MSQKHLKQKKAILEHAAKPKEKNLQKKWVIAIPET